MRNFAGGGGGGEGGGEGLFHAFMGIWGGMLWSFRLFSKLKATICKYWSLIKIKITMTFVFNEYEVKMKIAQEQWLELKMKLFLTYNMKMII